MERLSTKQLSKIGIFIAIAIFCGANIFSAFFGLDFSSETNRLRSSPFFLFQSIPGFRFIHKRVPQNLLQQELHIGDGFGAASGHFLYRI